MEKLCSLLSSIKNNLKPDDEKRLCDLFDFLKTDEGRKFIGFNNELLTEIVFHTVIHCENLLGILNKLNETTNFATQLNSKELVILISSILLHDAGLSLIPIGKDVEIKIKGLMGFSLRELRRNHSTRFEEWIDFKSNKDLLLRKGFLEKDEIPAITLLSKYHSKSATTLGDCLNKSKLSLTNDSLLNQVSIEKERLKSLISILRLIDACDVNKNRVTQRHLELSRKYIEEFNNLLMVQPENETIKDNIQFLEEQMFHYQKHLCFSGTLFSLDALKKIEIVLVPSLDQPYSKIVSIFNATKRTNTFSGPQEDILEELNAEGGIVKYALQQVGIEFAPEPIRLFDPYIDNLVDEILERA